MTLGSLWPVRDFAEGVSTSRIDSWTGFHDVVQTLIDRPHYVFRGQRKSDWLLESTLNRTLKTKKLGEALVRDHLKHFKYAIRGRRGPNPTNPEDADYFWSLGQHHGLVSPLLDWTHSPYVALFFAYARSEPDTDTDYRAVFMLNMNGVIEISRMLKTDPFADSPIAFVNPLSDENARLVSQAGLFTRLPYNQDLEAWVRNNHSKKPNSILLAKIFVPNKDRDECLKSLNRMNINYATLFPDLEGASEHCNLMLQIPNYASA